MRENIRNFIPSEARIKEHKKKPGIGFGVLLVEGRGKG